MLIYAPHLPESYKLNLVKQEMLSLGAPVIRVIWSGDCYTALEGSHRLAAANQLGIIPNLVVLTDSDLINHDFQDYQDLTIVEDLVTALANAGYWSDCAYEFNQVEVVG